MGGGDVVVMFKDTPGRQALIKYLATPEAADDLGEARRLHRRRTRTSTASVYPDAITRATAKALVAGATTFRFDMSDLQPAAFGGTTGQGEWKIFQDFLKNPTNINGTAQQLEAAAAKAYKSGVDA